jgi:WD40 repeat protein
MNHPAKAGTTNFGTTSDVRDFAWYYLWRMAHSAGTATLREHKDTVRHAAFSYDGSKAVTLGDDGLMVVWDTLTGRSLQTLPLTQGTFWQNLYVPTYPNQAGRAGGLAIATEGQWAAACGATVWTGDLTRPAQPQRYGEHTASVLSLALSRSGNLLATGDEQGEIILRELPGGKIVRRWKNGKPQALAFTHDAKFLLAGMRHGSAYVWDVASGIVKDTQSFGQPITSLAVARDGQTVAVSLADREGVVCLWEPASHRIRAELRGHRDQVTHVTFSPDGRLLLTASRDHTARLWTVTGGLLRTYRGHLAGLETADFDWDGQRIITGSSDKTAILWKAAGDPQCDVLTDTPASGWVGSLAFSPGNDRLIGAGCCETSEAFLGQWNLADANRPIPLQSSVMAGTALDFSPDGKLMVVGEGVSLEATAASRLRLWNLQTGQVVITVPGFKGRIATAAYSPDGRLLAAALGDPDERVPGMVRIWEPAAGTQRYTLPALAGQPEAAFSPDGKLMVTVTNSKRRPGEIRLWNPATGEALGQIAGTPELQNVTAMALSPDGRSLVTGHGDLAGPVAAGQGKLKLWDLAKKQLVAQYSPAHPVTVTKITFSRRGKLVASGDAAGNVRVWDFTTGKPLPSPAGSVGGAVTGLAFDLLGDRLATAANERCVRVWHVDTGRQLARMELATSTPTAIRFTPDGNALMATTSTGGLIAWDAKSYGVRGLLRAEGSPAGQEGHAGTIAAAVVTSSGTRVISGGSDKTVRVWDLGTRRLLATPFTFNQPIACMALASARKVMAVGTGSAGPNFQPGELILCQQSGPNSQPVSQVLFQGIAPTCLAFTPDGNTLAVCAAAPDGAQGLRQSVALVNLTTWKATTMPTSDTQSVAVSPDGRLLAIGRGTGEIELWGLESRPAMETKRSAEPRRFSQNQNDTGPHVVLCAYDGDPRAQNGTGAGGRYPSPGGRDRRDGLAAAASSYDSRDSRYPAAPATPTGAPATTFGPAPAPAFPAAPAFGAAPAPGMNVVPVAPAYQSAPAPIAPAPDLAIAARPVVLLGHHGAVKSLAFSPDSKTLASGAEDGDAKLWDAATGEELLTFKHNGAVGAVQFSSDGKVLATANREPSYGGIRLWRAALDDR